MKTETLAVHAGHEAEMPSGAEVPPIYTSVSFVISEVGKDQKYGYSRSGNPTRDRLERCIAVLERTKFGLAFSSGMAAISAISSLLGKDSEILLCNDVYGGTYKLFKEHLPKYGIVTTDVDATRPDELEDKITDRSKMIWLESPTNPLLKVIDIKAIAKIAQSKGVLLIVDNTLASPYLQNPVLLGADIVVHSTKYISGHGDSIGGVLATSNEDLYSKLKFMQNKAGGILSPFDCYLTLRGVRTLHLRMERHSENATAIADFLAKDSRIREVSYPFLPSSSSLTIAKSQMRSGGGILSFRINGSFEIAQRFLRSLKIFKLGVGLGSVSSLACHPSSMTHRSLPSTEKQRLRITDDLIRMSVGVENADDLIQDVSQALDSAFGIEVMLANEE